MKIRPTDSTWGQVKNLRDFRDKGLDVWRAYKIFTCVFAYIELHVYTSNTYCFRTWRWIALFGGTCVVVFFFFLNMLHITKALQSFDDTLQVYAKTIIMQSNKPNHKHHKCTETEENALTNCQWCSSWTILYFFTLDKLFSFINIFYFITYPRYTASIRFIWKYVLCLFEVFKLLWCLTKKSETWYILLYQIGLKTIIFFYLPVVNTL